MQRRAVLAAAGLLSTGAIAMPSDDWVPTAPEAAGFAPDLAKIFAAGLRSGLLRNVHALLVARGDRLVLEYYGAGPDEAWGRDLGQVVFGPEVLHDLRSVTKSVTGLLYGIALDHGQVPPPAAPLLAQFLDYADLSGDPRRAAMTVNHALTMTMGLAWDESLPYTDPRNSEIAMENAQDRLCYALAQPVVAAPGSKWIYSGGAVALVAALIARGTGRPLEDFAREALFAPLGIAAFEWAKGRDSVASAASGLRLRPRDLLRLGRLALAGGQWGGRQVVSRGWIEAATRPAIATGDGLEYGRLWFLGAARTPALPGPRRWFAGFGNGGQRLWVLPDADLTVVSLSGAYNQRDSWITPARIFQEIVVANLLR